MNAEMLEKRRVLICRFREHVHAQGGGEGRIVRGIGRVRGVAAGGRDVRDKGSRARDGETRGTYVCTYGVCLSRRCLPCSFLRSSINETRVQSRRMSNKYVSYSTLPPPLSVVQRSCPPPHPGRLLTLFTLFLLNSPRCRVVSRRPSS